MPRATGDPELRPEAAQAFGEAVVPDLTALRVPQDQAAPGDGGVLCEVKAQPGPPDAVQDLLAQMHVFRGQAQRECITAHALDGLRRQGGQGLAVVESPGRQFPQSLFP